MKILPTLLPVLVLSTAAAAQDPCGTWTEVPVGNPAGSTHTMLHELTVLPSGDTWAVGSKYVLNGIDRETQTLAYRWDGASWIVVPTPSPTPYPGGGWADLQSVEAVAPNDVWAAGGQRIQAPDGFVGTHLLVEHWNGSQWSIVPAPVTLGGSGNFVDDIEAISPDDIWFVGDWLEFPATSAAEKRALAMHWDGSGFTIFDTPFFDNQPIGGHGLTAVSAVSSDDVWAVGGGHDGDYVGFSYIVHWNGSQWQYEPGPTAGWMQRWYDVQAVATDDVWAVGEYDDASGAHGLFAHWDGTSWTRLPDSPVGAASIEVMALDRVYVGGNGVALWNGSSWSVVTTLPGVTSPSLWSLERIGPCSIWAAGRQFEGQILPLTARLDPSGGPVTFCAITPNSSGPGATIGWTGSGSIAANDLVLTAAGMPSNKLALFFYGDQRTSVPYGNGVRCVGGQIHRLPAIHTTASGTASQAFPYAGSPVVAGSTWNFQLFFRDAAAGGACFDSTNALEVRFTP
jgi:hypothetical protein